MNVVDFGDPESVREFRLSLQESINKLVADLLAEKNPEKALYITSQIAEAMTSLNCAITQFQIDEYQKKRYKKRDEKIEQIVLELKQEDDRKNKDVLIQKVLATMDEDIEEDEESPLVNYYLTYSFVQDINAVKTLCNTGKFFNFFPENILRPFVEQLAYKADLMFFVNAIIDEESKPDINEDMKNAFFNLRKWLLFHLCNAVIFKILIESKPVTYGSNIATRGSVDNTTRITIYYQINSEDSYKLRIDLPHKGVDLPHINFYFLKKEMIGPIPIELYKKYEPLGIVYQDRNDGCYYFDNTEKPHQTDIKNYDELLKDAEDDKKKYRHENTLLQSNENQDGFNVLFDSLIANLQSHSYHSLETTHNPNDDNDTEIFEKMRICGLAPLISLTYLQHSAELKEILAEKLVADGIFKEEDFVNCSAEELFSLFVDYVFDKDERV